MSAEGGKKKTPAAWADDGVRRRRCRTVVVHGPYVRSAGVAREPPTTRSMVPRGSNVLYLSLLHIPLPLAILPRFLAEAEAL
jgi:hypothetical protein